MAARTSFANLMVVGPQALRPRYVALIVIALFAAYLAILHPWLMAWGTTPAEQSMALPGDELVLDPGARITRGITINAPPDRIWPWLLQIGQDRAGFYSNDWLENLTTADIHNADEIRPEWQQRAVGDLVPMSRPDFLGGAMGEATYLRLRLIEPERVIADLPGTLILQPIDADTTRLLMREPRVTPAGDAPSGVVGTLITRLTWDPMHFVMVKGMLRGIKARAEGQPVRPPLLDVAARVGWAGAVAGVVALFLARRRRWPWLLVPGALVVAILWKTGDPDAAAAGLLSLGITILGALILGRRWWAPFTLVAAFVLLVLLLAPDAYVAFGLAFDPVIGVALVAWLRSGQRPALAAAWARSARSA
jgi:hypothetical protein